MEQKIEDYKKWLIDYLGVDDLTESGMAMDELDFVEAIMEFEKVFACDVHEMNHQPSDFKTLNKFVEFLLTFINKD